MSQNSIIDTIENQEWLGKAGGAIQPVIIKAFEAGGSTGEKIKNFLHGTWLGHPLHPALTDVPIGAWTSAAVLDSMELAGNDQFKSGADAAVAIGLAGALGAAVTGLTDWTGTSNKKRKLGLMHALLNITATGLYVTSLILRGKSESRKAAISCSMAGYGVMTAAAWLGGHLVFNEQIGVNHTATSIPYPKDFVPVLPESELADHTMQCVKAGNIPVVLAKKDNHIYALANTCSHFGGPLCEGKLLDAADIQCPWHGSVFSLKDGSVINGPATESQPVFDVRIRNGQIEVKHRKS
jgi:nitrite reductase/ring-hydroxylating ferredoxin subunit/uncharacterized membrane protein